MDNFDQPNNPLIDFPFEFIPLIMMQDTVLHENTEVDEKRESMTFALEDEHRSPSHRILQKMPFDPQIERGIGDKCAVKAFIKNGRWYNILRNVSIKLYEIIEGDYKEKVLKTSLYFPAGYYDSIDHVLRKLNAIIKPFARLYSKYNVPFFRRYRDDEGNDKVRMLRPKLHRRLEKTGVKTQYINLGIEIDQDFVSRVLGFGVEFSNPIANYRHNDWFSVTTPDLSYTYDTIYMKCSELSFDPLFKFGIDDISVRLADEHAKWHLLTRPLAEYGFFHFVLEDGKHVGKEEGVVLFTIDFMRDVP